MIWKVDFSTCLLYYIRSYTGHNSSFAISYWNGNCFKIRWNITLFCNRYGKLRLIDLPKLQESMPLTMSDFMDHVSQSSEHCKSILAKKWMPECCDLIMSRKDTIEQDILDDSVSLNLDLIILWTSFLSLIGLQTCHSFEN